MLQAHGNEFLLRKWFGGTVQLRAFKGTLLDNGNFQGIKVSARFKRAHQNRCNANSAGATIR